MKASLAILLIVITFIGITVQKEQKAFSHKSVSGHASTIRTLLRNMKNTYTKQIADSLAQLKHNRKRRSERESASLTEATHAKNDFNDSKEAVKKMKLKNEKLNAQEEEKFEDLREENESEVAIIKQMEKLLGVSSPDFAMDFGDLGGVRGFKDSKIVSGDLKKALKKMLPRHGKYTLCYRGSRDGYNARAFHSRCDNKGASVTIVKTNRGNIFGGYTSLAWNSQARYKTDADAFLFGLKGPQTRNRGGPFKVLRKRNQYSIYDHPSYGPTFGNGHDLHISNSMRSNHNYLNSGHGYNIGRGQLEGAYNFYVNEIEVYINTRKSRGFKDSKILTEQSKDSLRKMVTGGNYKLVYRGSRDGFNAAAFHKKANSYQRTVTVIKSRRGNVFGGFSSIPWRNSNGYRVTGNNFLFTLVTNKKSNPRKFFQKSNNYAIYDHQSYGPTFGGGHDLYVPNNMKGNGYLNGPHSYTATRGYLNGGNYNFVVSEIEVYADLRKTKGFKDSKIMSASQVKLVKSWVDGGVYKLCYRGSKHGFNAGQFHNHVNNKGKTVTVIKTQRGQIFGGWTASVWKNRNNYAYHTTGFLFSLNKQKRCPQRTLNHVVYDHQSYGPTFGGGHDIYVANNMKSNSNYINGPHAYMCSRNDLNAGRRNFKVQEIEVYCSSN